MIEITNHEQFGAAIAEALAAAEINPNLTSYKRLAWINAIGKAARRIETDDVFMTFQPEKDALLIWSPSNEIYEAGTVCQCRAFQCGQPCWHRAAKRLVERYLARAGKKLCKCGREAVRDNFCANHAPYLKPDLGRKTEKIGGIRI